MGNQRRAQKHAGHAFSQFELSKMVLNNLSQFNLKPITKLVLLFLCDCYNPKKAEIFPKQKTIANKLGVSEASVIRAIQELHQEGLIISERKYTNLYKFTAKIACYCPQNKKICEDKMQDEKSQIECNKLANCELYIHEQIKEQIKEQTVSKTETVEEFKILKDYAVANGAKNIPAYINALKKNGSAGSIIAKQKEKATADRYAQNQIKQTQTLIAEWNTWTADDPNKCEAWVNMKNTLCKNSHKKIPG